MSESEAKAVVGLEVTGLLESQSASPASQDVFKSLQAAKEDKYDFVTTVIPDCSNGTIPVVRDDVTSLPSKWWSTSVVGVVPTIQQVESCLEWGQHMALPAIILPSLPLNNADHICEYAALLAGSLHSLRDERLWIPVRLQSEHVLEDWFLFHRLVDYHPSISILLLLDPSPSTPVEASKSFIADSLHRFHVLLGSAAPVEAVGLSTGIFLTNKKGYPALPKAQQAILSHVFRRIGTKLRLLVIPSTHNGTSLALSLEDQGPTRTKPHVQYLQHFRCSRQEITSVLDTEAAEQELDYYDILQKPLQPLADHLLFQTYEVFERDPVKYLQYKRAVQKAMQDFLTMPTSSAPFTILVAGAGRGPLVTACLQAYQELSFPLPFRVFAVEKNPSAVVYLHSKLRKEWNTQTTAPIVTVVQSDLRDLSASQLFGQNSTDKVNLVVSELLGSFGCNELSPECLDTLFTATNVCGPHTISIPTRYTCFAAPVASIKLHQKVVEQALFPDPERGSLYNNGLTRAFETPYVVRPHAASQMAPAQDCWEFCHPSSTTPQHQRHASLVFPPAAAATRTALGCGYGPVNPSPSSITTPSALSWTCTGLLGTFTADLYLDEDRSHYALSTNPETFSEGMFSWFPLYFPLAQPLVVPVGGTVHAHLFRKSARDRVWYEWSVHIKVGSSVVAASPLHNPGGRSYHVSSKS